MIIFIGTLLIFIKIMLFNFDCVIRRNIIISGFSLKSKIINLGLNKRLITISEVHLKYLYVILYQIYSSYLETIHIPKLIGLKRDLKECILCRFVRNLSESCNILKFSKTLSFQNEQYQEWSLWRAFTLDFEIIHNLLITLFVPKELKVKYVKQMETNLLILNPEFYALIKIYYKIIHKKAS